MTQAASKIGQNKSALRRARSLDGISRSLLLLIFAAIALWVGFALVAGIKRAVMLMVTGGRVNRKEAARLHRGLCKKEIPDGFRGPAG